MLFLLLVTAFLVCASAQVQVTCECALFSSLQLDPDTVLNPVPLEYYGQLKVDGSQCDRPIGSVNDCLVECQQEFASQGGLEADLCTRTNGQSPRCTGSQWCESLHNSGVTTVVDGEGVVSLYYRMSSCNSELSSWQYGFREVNDDGLCCNNGQFSHCTLPCEVCEANNLCECGAFIASQFDLLPGSNPLPIYNIGTEWGPGGDFACNNWPGPDFGHPCDTSCLTASQFYKNNRALQDPAPQNPSISLGQYYCQVLKARWDDQWPANGVGPEDIVTFARMPGCNPGDGTSDYLKWNTARPYTCHHQPLCCDGEGNYFRC